MTYTKEEFLKAAEIGEVSMIDAKHIVSLLDKARKMINNIQRCETCKYYFTNPFDMEYCELGYDIENDKDCGFTKYKKI